MFQFAGYALRNKSESTGFTRRGFPIRKFPDQRLLGTSPKLIAAVSRPSSPLWSQGILRVLLSFPFWKTKNRISMLFGEIAFAISNQSI